MNETSPLLWSEVVVQSAAIHPEWGAEMHDHYLAEEAFYESSLVRLWFKHNPNRAIRLREIRWFMRTPAFLNAVCYWRSTRSTKQGA